jgi:hypothetical protein
MKNKKTKLVALLVLGFGIKAANGQQAITTTGGNGSGSGGTVSYTVGQIVYTTHSDTKGTIVQGVQQPYEVLVITGIDNCSVDLKLAAYPNPTTGFLTLQVGNAELYTLNFELYDIAGKLIETRKIISPTETICMDNLPAAVYFLKVTNNKKEVKKFKIIKK